MDSVSSSTNSFEQTTEIYIKKILPGSVENVRRQLAGAVESLGYDILEDEPQIVARRGAKGWATWYASADVLDYAAVLTVRLKAVGENSTRATFDYLVKHPMLNKSERNILVQEAETIAAISKKQAIEKICSVCETESTDDSKFCRKCGAPLTSEQAEREVLRMMAEVRAGKTSVVAAAILSAVSAILIAAAFVLNNLDLANPKLYRFPLLLGLLGMLCAAAAAFFGWYRLKRALDKPASQTVPNISYRRVSEPLATGELLELQPPPSRVPASVTEGTTNLLDEEEWRNRREKEKIPIAKRQDTNNFE